MSEARPRPTGAAAPDLQALFEDVRCQGSLCVVDLDSGAEVSLDADAPAVAASVFKVSVALEAERQFADGRLDPLRRVVLASSRRTPGPVGFSLFQDDVEVSLRDLVPAMLTISDNVATDALLAEVGVDAVNASTTALGLTGTVLTADLHTIVDSIGIDAGFASWEDMQRWWATGPSADDARAAEARLLTARELQPATATRTTARDMASLLRLIWRDEAAPPAACARVRAVMAGQLTKNRIASGFAPAVRVAAKSGGLAGVVRNEVGVVQFPDGRRYAAALFARVGPGADEREVNAAIGRAAACAVEHLAGSAA